jgi:hypothetical protein
LARVQAQPTGKTRDERVAEEALDSLLVFCKYRDDSYRWTEGTQVMNAEPEKAGSLPVAMTGRASAAKAAVGDKPVFAYIASLPQPQRGIAEAVDALAAKTLPDLERSVKWGMAYYGVGDGWCFSCGAFAGHVKLMFINGSALSPVPPVTPVGMGKATRGVELESLDDLDEAQLADWMRQATAVPGVGGKRKP